jgi:hypothetical protein
VLLGMTILVFVLFAKSITITCFHKKRQSVSMLMLCVMIKFKKSLNKVSHHNTAFSHLLDCLNLIITHNINIETLCRFLWKQVMVMDFANDGYDIKKHYLIRRLLANQNSIICSHWLLEGSFWPINIITLILYYIYKSFLCGNIILLLNNGFLICLSLSQEVLWYSHFTDVLM